MHVLLNLQGLHSTSHFLLVILLVYWYNLSARLWLLWSSILQAPHIHLRPAQLPTSLCATERRIQQQEKWWSSSSQQKNGAISGWQLVCTLRVLRPVLFNRYRHVSMIRREEVNTPLKFAADNRLGSAVHSFERQDALQRDVNTLEH